ncbi:MAG: class II fumarate hydratase [Planctomycetia bacterium]|nr:class II fumarate hydratase [Planctomycetia bacterium]
MTAFRTERDSMGEVRLPADVYYAAQTQRAVENFPISGKPLPPRMIRAMALVKYATTCANRDLGLLEKVLSSRQIEALLKAAREVGNGALADQFPVDVYQTGSGTSSNMNMNEVLAHRAMEISGENRFASPKSIHPNDHVNMGQSTNDTFPTAIHVAAAVAIKNELLPALTYCTTVLYEKAELWSNILKIGRTHLADATPMTLGQEFSSFARQMELAYHSAGESLDALMELPVGGTAVGSGINTHPEFAKRVTEYLAKETEIPFLEAKNHFEANAQRTGIIKAHSLLKTVATTLLNVANNIRILGSGPRCGFYEIRIPDLQPGSSIMPGKVNPVLCESMMQVAAKVIGNDAAITVAGVTGGQFQLNIMMPMMADVLLESINIMANCVNVFTRNCLTHLEANQEICEAGIEKSLSMCTSLNSHIGYERAAAIAKEAFKTGKTIREICIEQNILPKTQLDAVLNPMNMTKPGV